MAQHFFLTITAPSGTGKNTVIDLLLGRDPTLQYCVTATTRPPRPGEQDGVDYFFLTKEVFQQKIAAGDLLEYAQHYDNFYGTLKHVVRQHFAQGEDVMSDITWPGVDQLSKRMPQELVTVLLLPPSVTALEHRLHTRGLTTKESAEQFAQRLAIIRKDMDYIDRNDFVFQNPDMLGSRKMDYDYVVVNDHIDQTLAALEGIIQNERTARRK